MEAEVRAALQAQAELFTACLPLAAATGRAAALLADTLRRGGKALFCGNGGSAADAQHLAAELVVRLRAGFDRPGLPGIALSADSAILTACGNDFGFASIFARQVQALGRPGDLLFAFSTSGRSANVLEAVRAAAAMDIPVVFLTGREQPAAGIAPEVLLQVPSGEVNRIQEVHIFLGHQIIALAEQALFSGGTAPQR